MSEVEPADQFAVRATLARYCHRCDDGDFAGLVELFTADGVFVHGDQTVRGTAELLAFFEGTQGKPRSGAST
ncbi:nuclear transport factor 2 family protein [Frankia sp. AgKG'84/4]|uniref:nuclear transport factor 2 family protein n=1 Tax=Frankia sp. AgKG'84/4 TaxID=573490 RepID=UPI00202A1B2A|nr:nuclear transport factor 2 family protein [Frankia sp. AgKG'84/4]